MCDRAGAPSLPCVGNPRARDVGVTCKSRFVDEALKCRGDFIRVLGNVSKKSEAKKGIYIQAINHLAVYYIYTAQNEAQCPWNRCPADSSASCYLVESSQKSIAKLLRGRGKHHMCQDFIMLMNNTFRLQYIE